jgi:hypothetical protein
MRVDGGVGARRKFRIVRQAFRIELYLPPERDDAEQLTRSAGRARRCRERAAASPQMRVTWTRNSVRAVCGVAEPRVEDGVVDGRQPAPPVNAESLRVRGAEKTDAEEREREDTAGTSAGANACVLLSS